MVAPSMSTNCYALLVLFLRPSPSVTILHTSLNVSALLFPSASPSLLNIHGLHVSDSGSHKEDMAPVTRRRKNCQRKPPQEPPEAGVHAEPGDASDSRRKLRATEARVEPEMGSRGKMAEKSGDPLNDAGPSVRR